MNYQPTQTWGFLAPDYTTWDKLPKTSLKTEILVGDYLMYVPSKGEHSSGVFQVVEVIFTPTGQRFAFRVVMLHTEAESNFGLHKHRSVQTLGGASAMYRYRKYNPTPIPPTPAQESVETPLDPAPSITQVEQATLDVLVCILQVLHRIEDKLPKPDKGV